MKLIDCSREIHLAAFNAEARESAKARKRENTKNHETTKGRETHEVSFGKAKSCFVSRRSRVFAAFCAFVLFVYDGLRKHVPRSDHLFYRGINAIRDRGEVAHLAAFARFGFAVKVQLHAGYRERGGPIRFALHP